MISLFQILKEKNERVNINTHTGQNTLVFYASSFMFLFKNFDTQ